MEDAGIEPDVATETAEELLAVPSAAAAAEPADPPTGERP
jgi:hypothetical protein